MVQQVCRFSKTHHLTISSALSDHNPRRRQASRHEERDVWEPQRLGKFSPYYRLSYPDGSIVSPIFNCHYLNFTDETPFERTTSPLRGGPSTRCFEQTQAKFIFRSLIYLIFSSYTVDETDQLMRKPTSTRNMSVLGFECSSRFKSPPKATRSVEHGGAEMKSRQGVEGCGGGGIADKGQSLGIWVGEVSAIAVGGHSVWVWKEKTALQRCFVTTLLWQARGLG